MRDLEAIGKPSTKRFIHSTTVLVRMLSTLDLVGSRTSCDGNGTGPVFRKLKSWKKSLYRLGILLYSLLQTRNAFWVELNQSNTRTLANVCKL